VLKARAKDEVTSSGIVLPDTATEKPQEGHVLSVGPGRVLESGKRLAVEVKAGDTVLFARYAGTEVKLDGQDYLVMRENDLLAIVKNGKKSERRELKMSKKGGNKTKTAPKPPMANKGPKVKTG